MIEMYKKVLRGVSFDTILFRKELLKAKQWLKKEEATMLKAWALTTFTGVHKDLIIEVFEKFN